MQKELRYPLGLFLFAVLLCSACSRVENAQKQSAPLRVNTMVIAPQTNYTYARYVGTVEAQRETPLSMRVSGKVLSIHCQDGDRVRQGQVLLRIDSTQSVHALQAAEATLRQAQDGYDRMMQVYAKGAVTDQKKVEVESQLAQARSLYEAARQQVNECALKAPCDGLVQGMQWEIGQMVMPGIRVCSILDVTAFTVRFTVPEAEIHTLAMHARGEMECAAVNAVFPITVTQKSMKANALSHTYEVTARIQGGTEVLMPGMVAIVKVKGESLVVKGNENIIIPANCVLLKPEGATVWVKENGQAQRRAITIDGYLSEGVRVESGLQAGDSLITDGYQKLYIGCNVICD